MTINKETIFKYNTPQEHYKEIMLPFGLKKFTKSISRK